jgi:hypothetical protein
MKITFHVYVSVIRVKGVYFIIIHDKPPTQTGTVQDVNATQ